MGNKTIWCILVVLGSLIALQSCESKRQGGRSGGGGASGTWEEERDMGIKADFISELRKTPDGILNFLNTPLPDPPDVEYPTTKDESVVVQGMLAAYVLKAIRPFAGWTPVESMMRVGQHSNPLESITLSILEYLSASDAEKAFTIEEPVEGQAYAPGDIRIIVKAKGKIATVSASTNNPLTEELQTTNLTSTDGEIFYGYIRLSTEGAYISVVTAKFDDKNQTAKTASVHYSITEDGEVQGDLADFNLAAKKVEEAADGLMSQVVDAALGAALEMAAKALFVALLAL